MNYQFGDQDLAARRLQEVARVFEASTREFLGQASPPRGRLAYDLGCGPGFTTRLVQETAHCGAVVGLDSSERFLALARERNSSGMRFHRHDVLSTPFPDGPANLLFCRFLLSHLPEPRACLQTWATQLAPGGLLVMEEVEAIETTQPVFQRYLGIVASMLRNERTELYVGRALHALEDLNPLQRRMSRAQQLAVSDRDAATMFSMNVPNWRDRPFIQQNVGAAAIGRLESELSDLTRVEGGESSIIWTLRQIVFERSAEAECKQQDYHSEPRT